MSNIKKKLETSHFLQAKVSSVCVLSKAKNALPHKGGRQAANKKPSRAIVIFMRAKTRLFSEESERRTLKALPPLAGVRKMFARSDVRRKALKI